MSVPRPSEGVAVALVAAVSALVGTAVGAAITYLGDQHLQERQVAQEEARQTTAARAVARILMSEYKAQYRRLGGMIAESELEPASYHQRIFVSQVGVEDRKLLAGRLNEKDWTSVSTASQFVEDVEGDLETHHGEGHVDTEEQETLELARSACKTAYVALTPLAEGRASA